MAGSVAQFGGANREGADGSFAEIFGFDAEGMVEASAVILPRNRRGEFHKLCFVEPLSEAGEERIGDDNGSFRHGIGILEDEPLKL